MVIRLLYMDDTIINYPALEVFDKNTELSSSEVTALIKQDLSLVTVKRQLSVLVGQHRSASKLVRCTFK